ncbi:ATPase [Cohnella pontilimi]|uniref:ATPase n=1 Tax=Cohnella pontilimi TaxID=2564100 RepID=A0A4U0FKA6_9BACL|nr:SRPBCC family protein [Cohnella pontilimi]TJY43982.1 ATPase [Cohnella pontilimi]
MTNKSGHTRTDSASRVIQASPQTIYHAFIDPQALVSWLPPEGMKGQIHQFDPREGGAYRMTLTYETSEHSTAGKTSEHEDVVQGTFLELVPDERVVQQVEFDSDDPAFSGTMTMTWTIKAVPEGTEVTIVCDNVPGGIRKEDHLAGFRSTLENLAAFTE